MGMRYAAILLIAFLAACGGNSEPEKPNAPKPDVSREDSTQRADSLRDRAKALLQQSNYEAALPLLQEATDLAPQDWQNHAQFGIALEKLKRYAEALSHFEIAAKLAQGQERADLRARIADSHHKLARAAYDAQENKLAIEHLRDGLRLRPAEPEMNLLLGFTHYRLGEFAEAEKAFSVAATGFMQPQRYEAQFWWAQTLTQQQKHEEAVEAYTVLIEQGVTGNDVYGWRAYSKYALGDVGGARRDFVSAVEYASSAAKRSEFSDQLQALSRSSE